MELRSLGKTDLKVSALGFGCGAVGGILVKGDRTEMINAVARAVELGVTYFDTAAIYGGGISEKNLGMAIREVGSDVVVGTKIMLLADELEDIQAAVARRVDESLNRIGYDTVDLVQLHNFVVTTRIPDKHWLSVEDAEQVLDAFARQRDKGKIRYWGINGLGDVSAIHRCVEADVHSMQICYNLLNPTAGMPAPKGFPFEDHHQIIDKAAENGVGVLAIRVLAGGALSGSVDRHAHATPEVEPISSGESYADDVRLAQRLGFLIREGFADSLVEAAIRFAIGKRAVSSAVIGISDVEQLEAAARYVARGSLPEEAVSLLQKEWSAFGGK